MNKNSMTTISHGRARSHWVVIDVILLHLRLFAGRFIREFKGFGRDDLVGSARRDLMLSN
ncbi:MAG TPA: hypothetical protein VHB27_24460 [Rhodopila sp.]|uniref:hypothetical protein n=1 Tax=Rhodopila sp. TaxID=2480087 RepID=UPI002CFEFF89|nr:hypothetical protein [Rhodopila sp.]HVY18395.1 hypothetical protein [Rhodopila sp.]